MQETEFLSHGSYPWQNLGLGISTGGKIAVFSYTTHRILCSYDGHPKKFLPRMIASPGGRTSALSLETQIIFRGILLLRKAIFKP